MVTVQVEITNESADAIKRELNAFEVFCNERMAKDSDTAACAFVIVRKFREAVLKGMGERDDRIRQKDALKIEKTAPSVQSQWGR